MSILRLENLTKSYRNVVAVDHVTFEVPRGSIFGLLGPNGAGKTSLIRIITTITGADSGAVYFNGEPLNSSHPARIGYLPEERGLYKKMKVGDQLLYLAQLKGLSAKDAKRRIGEALEKFEIQDWWHKKIEELSKGMQQKVQFISTILHDPKLIILDEPFSGLDPINTNLIKEEIRGLNANGTSVIFSTHRMEQVEEMCEDIVLINQGKNVLQGQVGKLKEAHKQGIYRLLFDGNLPDDLNGLVEVIADTDGELLIRVDANLSANRLLKALLDRNIEIRGFEEVLPTLNDIFIQTVEQQNHA